MLIIFGGSYVKTQRKCDAIYWLILLLFVLDMMTIRASQPPLVWCYLKTNEKRKRNQHSKATAAYIVYTAKDLCSRQKVEIWLGSSWLGVNMLFSYHWVIEMKIWPVTFISPHVNRQWQNSSIKTVLQHLVNLRNVTLWEDNTEQGSKIVN